MSTISPKAAKLEAALREAMLHHQAGRLSEAKRLYRRILRDRPSHPGTNTALGIALKDQDKLDEAAAAFQRVVAVAPDQARAYSASAADGRCLRRVRSSADRSRIGAPQQLAKCAIRARCSRVELKAE